MAAFFRRASAPWLSLVAGVFASVLAGCTEPQTGASSADQGSSQASNLVDASPAGMQDGSESRLAQATAYGASNPEAVPATEGSVQSRQAPFLILPLKDYNADAALAAGRAVRLDREEAPFAALRQAYPQHFLDREEVLFLTQGVLYKDFDSCQPPDLGQLVPRLHGFRSESWDGIVFANLETGCFRQIRGGRDNDAEVASAYDSTYAAWVRGIKQAWPNSLVFGFFLPGNTYWYMPSWPESGDPPAAWQALVANQTETLAAVDGLAPELYFPYDVLRDGDEALARTIEKYRRAMNHIVKSFPGKLVVPVVWLMYYHNEMPMEPPCGKWRPFVVWDGKAGETSCGYYGLSEEEGVRVLDMVRDAGAHGIFYWGSRTDWGMWQAGDPNSNAFAAIRTFLMANGDRPASAPGPATFLSRQ